MDAGASSAPRVTEQRHAALSASASRAIARIAPLPSLAFASYLLSRALLIIKEVTAFIALPLDRMYRRVVQPPNASPPRSGLVILLQIFPTSRV
jgi:hypothetical protein